MTSSKIIANIILGTGDDAVTIHTTSCEKIYAKVTTKITPSQSSANWSAGPKDTKIVDLMRIEIRYAIRGYIDSADEDKLDSLFKQGGVFNMNYKSETFTTNFEKLSVTENNSSEQDETDVMMTVIKGVNL